MLQNSLLIAAPSRVFTATTENIDCDVFFGAVLTSQSVASPFFVPREWENTFYIISLKGYFTAHSRWCTSTLFHSLVVNFPAKISRQHLTVYGYAMTATFPDVIKTFSNSQHWKRAFKHFHVKLSEDVFFCFFCQTLLDVKISPMMVNIFHSLLNVGRAIFLLFRRYRIYFHYK